ncbi:nucleolar complex protein 3 homolog [Orussus abietinus]|uniref:nucleolar complex protein 3 homolog n=1 Tax=Orussus abietinus TaxID=222816 RepID=UPI0006262D31|nr:nucleolar complex protein 3 homolog [Orussus abietinus]
MAKRAKAKISKVKRNNQTRSKLMRQGKIKARRHRKSTKNALPGSQNVPAQEPEEEITGEDMLGMVQQDDLDFLKSAVSNKSYSILKQIQSKSEKGKPNGAVGKRKLDQELEDRYEEEMSKMTAEGARKRVRALLPLKARDGSLKVQIIEEEDDDEKVKDNNEDNFRNDSNENDEKGSENEENADNNTVMSRAQLWAQREESVQTRKLKIGTLCSGLLESPELKSENFKPLLELMDDYHSGRSITVRKLATVSLMEVFKDLLPSYHITQVEQEGVKFKKDTLQLQKYEAALLKNYRLYLQKLEKIAGMLRKRKKGDHRIVGEQEITLGEVAVGCMCDLLATHPYFNFSMNIANFLIPLLDSKYSNVRERVASCFIGIFKEDKRAELTLTIVRRLNQYIKSRGHSVHSEVLSVLMGLRIKDINLDQEKDEETKRKKLMSHKQRILSLSKRERKKNKQLEQVEKELLETKGEENKQRKQQTLTEIIKVVFTIYFRILKQAPNSKVLSVSLEGLAKFAHCINLDFYQDLVNALDTVMGTVNLGLREQLHCVETVFTILSGQGSALNIDPYKFYSHLYKNLLRVHCGKSNANMEIVIRILIRVLIDRRKKIIQSRLIAFVKRIATLTLQVQHHGAVAILAVIRTILQLGKAADVLLDTESTTGDGFYNPELEEPEYCNAHCSTMWELVCLQRHYHRTVQKFAKNIAARVPTIGEDSIPLEISKLSPEELYARFDPSGVAFEPPVPVPKKAAPKKLPNKPIFANHLFKDYIDAVFTDKLSDKDVDMDFSKAIKWR